MTERIRQLTSLTLSGAMYVKPVATQFDREDLFLPREKRESKQLCAEDEVQAISTTVQQCGNAVGQHLQCLSTDGDLDDDESDDELSDDSLNDSHPLNILLVPGQQPAQCGGDDQAQNVLQKYHSFFLFSFGFFVWQSTNSSIGCSKQESLIQGMR